MKALISAFALALLVTPALASSDRCLDGTAPAGWLRVGGYCDVAHDLRGPSVDAFRSNDQFQIFRIAWFDANGVRHVGVPDSTAVDIRYWDTSDHLTQYKDGRTLTFSVDADHHWHYIGG